MSTRNYGAEPERIGPFEPDWLEYMHYLYLPVVMAGESGVRLPERLAFVEDVVLDVCSYEGIFAGGHLGSAAEQFVYVTARRGFASPGNPLNRPGWHADGFGSEDINYVWADRWTTRFAVGDLALEPGTEHDHIDSVRQWTHLIDRRAKRGIDVDVRDADPRTVYRLTPDVIHATPIIPAPGGDRSFLKISVSPNRYNLAGNSRNFLFDYDWKMWRRDEVRNDPAYAGGDTGPQA